MHEAALFMLLSTFVLEMERRRVSGERYMIMLLRTVFFCRIYCLVMFGVDVHLTAILSGL